MKAFFLAALACAVLAEGVTASEPGAPGLQSYEPNTIGLTKDSDDVGFLDVKLSMIYPLLPGITGDRVYFAATVRFAQYIETRESSPVIGKRFNPKLIFWRHRPQNRTRDYVDFAYAHESNGQSINTPEEYHFEVQRQTATGNRPEFAKDFISRGWDYLEVAAKYAHGAGPDQPGRLTIYSSFRYFLDDGLLQGPAEEYNSWENDPEGKPRKEVQGLAVLFRYDRPIKDTRWVTGIKVAAGLETGYSNPLRYNTLRLEGRADVVQLPLLIFYQNGYNSDLALYYKRVSTVGIALELATAK